ncbi:hypothetical protein OAS39_07600 [Pirellulales bacterium]|nr:hypothetical protein [Pirellulales bacterium]
MAIVACLGCLIGSARAAEGPSPLGFSELPIEQQRQIEQRVAPPPTAERDAPYSTPMYYLMYKGFSDGPHGELLLDRNRPDWQEALLRDWSELGLTSTQALTTPKQWDDPNIAQAYRDYFRLSKRYGMAVGMRLAGDETLVGIEAEGWGVHPRNPDNRLGDYAKWAGRIAHAGKGAVAYYIIGDEVNSQGWETSDAEGNTVKGQTDDDRRWTPEDYIIAFKKITNEIRRSDPDAKVCMFGMNGIDVSYLDELFDLGYAEIADGVAANIDFGRYSPTQVRDFVEHVGSRAPNFKLYSNGVGYVAARDTNFYPANHGYLPVPDDTPDGATAENTNGENPDAENPDAENPDAENPVAENPDDHSPRLYSDEAQAKRIAKGMFAGFVAGWDVTPYYIVLRQWVLPDGTPAPHWYGFFGVNDLKVDEFGHVTPVRHAGWYAIQTISHIFYSKDRTKPAPFEIQLSGDVDQSWAFVRDNYECLLVLWNDSGSEPVTTEIVVGDTEFTYPVQISLFNYRKTTDLPYEIDEQGALTIHDVQVTDAPVIIRLVREEQVWAGSP